MLWANNAKLTVGTYVQQAYNMLDSEQPTEKIQITKCFFPLTHGRFSSDFPKLVTHKLVITYSLLL
jgi:hypothetical protein